jgi:hypothetical protein
MLNHIALATAIGFLASSAPVAASAHGGGLDASGCHHDRKRGGYHCHRRPAIAAAPRRKPASRPQNLATPGGIYYTNCSQARAAGAAPLRRGEPGYRPAMDRDDDGVACE